MSMTFRTRPDKEKPSRIFVHGVEKIGKTSFAAFAPSPVFLMSRGEDGLEVLISKGQLPEVPYLDVCQDWDDLLAHLNSLAREKHDRKTVVLDVCRGFERMLEERVIDDRYRGQAEGFHEFARGRKFSVPAWKDFLTGPLDALVARGMSVVVLAHSKTKAVKTPMGEDLLNYYPDSEECYWDETKKWVDQIVHLTRLGLVDRDALQKAKKFGDSAKYKNVEVAETRVVCTDQSIFYVAGGRLGLPDQIPLPTVARPAYPWEGAEKGWQAFQAAVRTSRAAALKSAGEWAAARAPKPAADAAGAGAPTSPPASPPPPPPAPAPAAEPAPAKEDEQRPDPTPVTPTPTAAPAASAPSAAASSASAPTSPAAGATSAPRIGGELMGKVAALLGEVGVDWTQIRDDREAGAGVAAACGFTPMAGLKLASLSADQGLALYKWAGQKKAEKDARKRKPKPVPEEAVA